MHYVYLWTQSSMPILWSVHADRDAAQFAATRCQRFAADLGPRDSWYTVESLDEADLWAAILRGEVIPPWSRN